MPCLMASRNYTKEHKSREANAKLDRLKTGAPRKNVYACTVLRFFSNIITHVCCQLDLLARLKRGHP